MKMTMTDHEHVLHLEATKSLLELAEKVRAAFLPDRIGHAKPTIRHTKEVKDGDKTIVAQYVYRGKGKERGTLC